MKTTKLIIAFLILLNTSLLAQYDYEALRYSNESTKGSARFLSMGGAFGALGGDFSTASSNPAGIGVYRKSEFVFTNDINTFQTNSNYNDISNSDTKYNYNINNFGFVFCMKDNNENNHWKNINFGFGMNKTALFNRDIIIQGLNSQSTLLDQYITRADGYSPNNLSMYNEGMAYQGYLLNPNIDSISYNHVINSGTLLEQIKSISNSGRIKETVFNLSANHEDKLYLGLTIGFKALKFREKTTYSEFDILDSLANFKSFSLNEDLTTKGNGVDLKFGFIYKISQWLRVGGAYHSPTFYTMSDLYSSNLKSNVNNNIYDINPANSTYDYLLETPSKMIGSIGLVLNKYFLVSGDYEYIDYKTAHFRPNSDYLSVNQSINNNFDATRNIRLGAEFRLQPYSFRVGLANFGNAYNYNQSSNSEKTDVSFGFGIREESYFIDFAYVISKFNEEYYLYNPALVNKATISNLNNSFLISIGFKW